MTKCWCDVCNKDITELTLPILGASAANSNILLPYCKPANMDICEECFKHYIGTVKGKLCHE
jgi:hypothetical protein